MRKFKIVIINGIASNGKDTFINFIREKEQVVNHSTIDTVKFVCRNFGANQIIQKGDKERKLWSLVKKAWIEYNNGPFNEIKDICNSLEQMGFSGILFLHIREPEEIDKIKSHFKDCRTLLIVGFNETVPDNDSDKNVMNYAYDTSIWNDGDLKRLKKEALKWLERLK